MFIKTDGRNVFNDICTRTQEPNVLNHEQQNKWLYRLQWRIPEQVVLTSSLIAPAFITEQSQ